MCGASYRSPIPPACACHPRLLICRRIASWVCASTHVCTDIKTMVPFKQRPGVSCFQDFRKLCSRALGKSLHSQCQRATVECLEIAACAGAVHRHDRNQSSDSDSPLQKSPAKMEDVRCKLLFASHLRHGSSTRLQSELGRVQHARSRVLLSR